MPAVVWLVAIAVILLFSFVIFFGAPFLPTLRKQVEPALDLLALKPGQTMLELGCGDGRILSAAAQRGIRGIGYELNPLLVLMARLRTWRYRRQVRIIWGNYWQAKWPVTDGIFVFLLNPYMAKLNKKIIQECQKPVKLVSFAFEIPERKPDKQNNGLYLYEYSH